jgi:sugar lactone lactonase YvrE
LLVSGLQGALGSTVGQDGALYAVEGVAGRVLRIDPNTGETTVFASGLPMRVLPLGGATDVAFIGNTAYVLVTLVSPDVGGTAIDGIYRVDSAQSFTVVADIGAWAKAHPPNTPFDSPTGLQFAIQTYRGGFLVSDANHNRVLLVTLDHSANFDPSQTGNIKELITFPNIVPTGLAVSGETIYVAEAGPDPHRPEDGKVVAFDPNSDRLTEVASGSPFLLDVEFGRGRDLYALSQGAPNCCTPVDSAPPNTGALVRVAAGGAFTTVVDHLDRPTSLQFIGNTAYVVSLAGQIWRIDDVSCPPYGALR